MATYLDYRNHRWPRTANPHLFVSQTTGCGVEPVSNVWINDVLGMSARRLGEDRLLHEAEATGGDPRRICDLFGLPVGAALRYTGTVDQPASSSTASATRDQHRIPARMILLGLKASSHLAG